MMHLSIDAGGTFIKYAWFQNDKILEQGKRETPYTDKEGFMEVIKSIWDSKQDEKEGISISLPGTIDPDTGYIIQGGSLLYHRGFNIKETYEAVFKTPVIVENDARCAAIAEMHNGNMQGIDNGIVLVFGTGVGGCFIVNGEIMRGAHLFSGEVSMMICDDLKTKGLDAILAYKLGIGHLVKRISEAKGVETVDGETVFEWIEKGDPIALEIFNEYTYTFATQIFNMQLMLDPQRLCIGGGVSENETFIKALKEAMTCFYDSLPLSIPQLEIVNCKFHNDANIWGAYYNYKNRIQNRNED